jgi:hypothetical protein
MDSFITTNSQGIPMDNAKILIIPHNQLIHIIGHHHKRFKIDRGCADSNRIVDRVDIWDSRSESDTMQGSCEIEPRPSDLQRRHTV